MGQGYSITTWRLHLRCRHPEWLRRTQEFYNQVEEFYYELLLAHPELGGLGSQKSLRELELLSIPGRSRKTPEAPLPWEKVPVYFRRAAANAGIAAAKSYLARRKTVPGRKARELNSAVVFYKGMYRDFSSTGITLKVWDGSRWQWMHCRLFGRDFPQAADIMSPSVVFEYKYTMLHIPVKEICDDTATIRQRLEAERNILSLQFSNSDVFAVGSVSSIKGNELAVKFWPGGREYSHQCKLLVEKIEKSKQSLGGLQEGRPNQKYWIRLKNLSEHYAHKISSEIVKFSRQHEAAIIVLPRYSPDYTHWVMRSSGNWGPLHLSGRIREYLTYKAWKAGIIVIEVHAKGISSVCAKCGEKIEVVDKKTNEYKCRCGYCGSRYLNSARNLGQKCLIQFGKHVG